MDHLSALYQLAVLASFRPSPDDLARALALQVLRDYRVAHVTICTIDRQGGCEIVGAYGDRLQLPGPRLCDRGAAAINPLFAGKAIVWSWDDVRSLDAKPSTRPVDYVLVMPLLARGILVGAATLGTDVHPQPEAAPQFWATMSLACGSLITPDRAPDEPGRSLTSSVTVRQRRILELVAEGLTNQQIGGRLGYSESTIGHDLVAAYERLGVRNRDDAVRALGLSGAMAGAASN